jgi:hypothetical protein
MPKYAFSHPGKIGDALYTLPTIKYICERDGATADFYTSNYCLPLTPLFEYQSFIEKLIVPESYVIRDMGCGVQPWQMPIPEGIYDQVFQLGFQTTPNIPLHSWIGQSVGIADVPPPQYQYPDITFFEEPYIVISARYPTTYNDSFKAFIDACPILTVQIGCPNEFLESKSANMTHLNMLETVSLMAKSKGFLGLPFSQLVLANGFPDIPKVGMHNGGSWDLRHVIQRPNNHYPVNPSTEELLRLLNLS